MKKVIVVLSSIFMLSGCGFFLSEEVKPLESQSIFLLRDIYKVEKPSIQTVWTLLDGRKNEVVYTVDLFELGFVQGNGLEEEKVKQLAKKLALGIDQPLINPTITRLGELKEGQNRVILSEEELADQLMSLAYYNKTLILPIYEEEPIVTIEDLLTIKDHKLSSYMTYFNPNVVGRSKNIQLSSQAIDHYVLAPNEVFSFNKAVGQRTKERGYQEAKEIVNKEFVIGIGGGICQTSSTLFNAIDQAGLEIVERYTHSREIGYVPSGRDATVSWGGPDFKFKNPYDYPLLISTETNIQTGKIEVEVYAAKQMEKLLASNE